MIIKLFSDMSELQKKYKQLSTISDEWFLGSKRFSLSLALKNMM